MLFPQGNSVHRHATVYGFAHVVNSEQGNLNGGERFHLDAGGADGFYGCGAAYAVKACAFTGKDGEFDAHMGERLGVAHGDEFAGFFGGHDGGNAGNA